MILKVENLGTLKEAQIDLSKDLIVLCGTNNSGKTYMAYSVFGLYRICNDDTNQFTNIRFKEVEHLFEEGLFEIDLIDLYKKNARQFFNDILTKFNKYLPFLFAADEDVFSNTIVSIPITDNSEELFFTIGINRQIRFNNAVSILLNKSENKNKLSITVTDEGKKNIDKSDILAVICNEIVEIFYKSIFNRPYIAPAERTTINIFSKELSIQRNNLVDKLLDLNGKKDSNPFDLLNRRASRYPLPIRESLEIAEDLKNLQSNKSEFSYFADAIEKEILGGKMKISKEGDVEFSPNSLKRKGLGIHLTGSMVKSLSSLVFYFRHLAQKNDFIIIDEPELNLHPDNQRKIAKLIVRFINAGFKVMISTHSDFIIRELNILMMLKSADNKSVANKLTKQYKYAQDELLDFNKVGAYFFDINRNTEIEVTNTGFEVSTIDKESIQQNEAAQDIFLKLYNDES